MVARDGYYTYYYRAAYYAYTPEKYYYNAIYGYRYDKTYKTAEAVYNYIPAYYKYNTGTTYKYDKTYISVPAYYAYNAGQYYRYYRPNGYYTMTRDELSYYYMRGYYNYMLSSPSHITSSSSGVVCANNCSAYNLATFWVHYGGLRSIKYYWSAFYWATFYESAVKYGEYYIYIAPVYSYYRYSYMTYYYAYTAEQYYYKDPEYSYYKYDYVSSQYYEYIPPYYAYTAKIETNPLWYYYRFV